MKLTVLYHGDADGFGAAFAIWKSIKDADATYIAVANDAPEVPEIPEGTDTLYIVDYSYSREVCDELAKKYKLRIWDHHATAAKELAGAEYATIDMKRAACAIVWDQFHPGEPLPDILQYVQDYDMWKFKLPASQLINLFIASLQFDFDTWDRQLSPKFLDFALAIGSGIDSFRSKQLGYAAKCARTMKWIMEFDVEDAPAEEYIVPVVNSAVNVSEVGHLLCAMYPKAPFAAVYHDTAAHRVWSLRSIGDFDVSHIAKMFGGGGHKNAAGFHAPLQTTERSSEEASA